MCQGRAGEGWPEWLGLVSCTVQAVQDRTEDQTEALLGCTKEQCLAINNIDYVMSHIQKFVEELGIQEVLGRLEEQQGGLVAAACRRSIKTLLKNSMENVENQILSVLEELGDRMTPSIQKFLLEPQPQSNQGGQSGGLLAELDSALVVLKDRLVVANFRRVVSVLWATAATCLSTILHQSIKRKRQPQFFVSLHSTFQVTFTCVLKTYQSFRFS